MATSRARRSDGLPPWVRLGVLAFIGGVVPLAVAAHFGAFGIPRNDDWAYALAAFRFAGTGVVSGTHWAGMNLVGQLVLALPMVGVWGESIRALQVEVAVLAVLALVAIDDLARSVVTARRALFVAVMVGVGPMWANLSASFMTDIPAFVCSMGCLALGVRALRPDGLRRGLFLTAVVLGFLGFAIREYALVAPLAVCLVAGWAAMAWGPRERRFIITVSAGLFTAAGLLFAWRSSLSGFVTVPLVLRWNLVQGAFHQLSQSAVLVGLLVAPAVLLGGPVRIVRAARRRAPLVTVMLATLTVLVLGAEVAKRRASSVILGPGNYVVPEGILGSSTAVGQAGDLAPRAVLVLLAIVGALSFAVVLLAAVPATLDGLVQLRRRDLRPPPSPARAVMAVAVAGYVAACAVPTFLGVTLFDRYLLPLVPLIGVLVLGGERESPGPPRVRRFVGGGALVVLAMLGFVYAANSASFDGTKWRVAEAEARDAGAPARVDGGFEWTNFQAEAPVWRAGEYRHRAGVCIVVEVASDEPRGRNVLRVEPVWGPGGPPNWIVARQHRPC